MFAGAAREAVFSADDVVQRVNKEFVPVALKAALINNPPPGIEGQLYTEISRSKPAPQGICVANSAGKVLAWTLSFDEDASVGKFLDHTLRRFKESPDAALSVTAERFMKFPSHKLADVEDTSRKLSVPERHTEGDRCPAHPALERGTLVGRIVGRPLDKAGQPIEKTLRQEDYMEARFEVPVSQQKRFAQALAESKKAVSISVPRELARSLVSHAYLGQLDVNPLGGRQTGSQTDREEIELIATRFRGDEAKQTLRITGTSLASGSPAELGVRTDGRRWEHRVQLTWEGYIDLEGNRMTGLALTAQGTERLRWGHRRDNFASEPDVAHLMAGHPIDLDCEVRYGLIAWPSVEADVVTEAVENKPPRGDDQPLTMSQRLIHLREAVKHLRAAGADDIADHIARQVRRMEQSQPRDRDDSKK